MWAEVVEHDRIGTPGGWRVAGSGRPRNAVRPLRAVFEDRFFSFRSRRRCSPSGSRCVEVTHPPDRDECAGLMANVVDHPSATRGRPARPGARTRTADHEPEPRRDLRDLRACGNGSRWPPAERRAPDRASRTWGRRSCESPRGPDPRGERDLPVAATSIVCAESSTTALAPHHHRSGRTTHDRQQPSTLSLLTSRTRTRSAITRSRQIEASRGGRVTATWAVAPRAVTAIRRVP